jgi:hypothetical protein
VELRLTDVDTRWQMQVYTELRRRRCERPRFDLRVFEEPIFEPDPIFERAPHTWGAWWRWVKRAVGYSWREATGTKRVVREGHHWQLQGVKLFEATFGFGPASVQPERVTLVRPEPDAAAAREEYRAVTADDPGGANSPPPAMPDAEMTVEQGRVGHEQVLAWLEGLPVSTREWAKLFPDDVLHDSLLPQVIAEASGRVPLSINSRENIAGIVRERRMALDDEERRGAAAGGGSGARARAGVWGRARAAAAASLLDVLDLDERSVSALRAWVEEFPGEPGDLDDNLVDDVTSAIEERIVAAGEMVPAGLADGAAKVLSELWERGLLVHPSDAWPFVHYCRSSLREIAELLSAVDGHGAFGDGKCRDCAEAVRQAREFAQRTLAETVPPSVEGGEEGRAVLVVPRPKLDALRVILDGEAHVCSCGDCESQAYADRCRFEAALRELVGA